jgi:hypothetical protein
MTRQTRTLTSFTSRISPVVFFILCIWWRKYQKRDLAITCTQGERGKGGRGQRVVVDCIAHQVTDQPPRAAWAYPTPYIVIDRRWPQPQLTQFNPLHLSVPHHTLSHTHTYHPPTSLGAKIFMRYTVGVGSFSVGRCRPTTWYWRRRDCCSGWPSAIVFVFVGWWWEAVSSG